MTASRWLIGLLVAFCLPALSASAGDSIWSGVVLVTSEPEPKPLPRQLERLGPTIHRVFGGNSLYLLGEKRKAIEAGSSEWLVPCKRIYMKVSVLAKDDSSYTLRTDLYEDKKLLVSADARLARDAPLYIRGPQWGKGQLVAILEVR